MKIYHLVRDEDESGVSGTGIVGEVVEFEDGASVLRWRKSNASGIASTVIYDSIIQLESIHGHGGKTRLVSCGEFFPRAKSSEGFPTNCPACKCYGNWILEPSGWECQECKHRLKDPAQTSSGCDCGQAAGSCLC